MTEIEDKSYKMSSNIDKTCPPKQCFGKNLSEIERHFKRLKVDESEKQSTNRSKSDCPVNYFSPKLSPYSPKMSNSSTDKRQSMNGFRRQRLHLIHKSKANSETSKPRLSEEECVAKEKEVRFCTDFSELKVEPKTEDKGKTQYFHKDFKLESNEWRNSVKEYHKMCKNSDNSSNIKAKGNKIKKLHFKDDKTCARQAMDASCDASADELAAYLDDTLFLPRKMSFMAEMMYT